MGWLVQEMTEEGETVCDPFMGSGSTGIACIRANRRFVGIEQDPTHYATALERITNELAQGDLFLGHNDQVELPPNGGSESTKGVVGG
jgi:DNA modification methylase